MILLGSLIYDGELAGRHVYTGPLDDEGTRWHDADQRTQVEQGINYLRDVVSRFTLGER